MVEIRRTRRAKTKLRTAHVKDTTHNSPSEQESAGYDEDPASTQLMQEILQSTAEKNRKNAPEAAPLQRATRSKTNPFVSIEAKESADLLAGARNTRKAATGRLVAPSRVDHPGSIPENQKIQRRKARDSHGPEETPMQLVIRPNTSGKGVQNGRRTKNVANAGDNGQLDSKESGVRSRGKRASPDDENILQPTKRRRVSEHAPSRQLSQDSRLSQAEQRDYDSNNSAYVGEAHDNGSRYSGLHSRRDDEDINSRQESDAEVEHENNGNEEDGCTSEDDPYDPYDPFFAQGPLLKEIVAAAAAFSKGANQFQMQHGSYRRKTEFNDSKSVDQTCEQCEMAFCALEEAEGENAGTAELNLQASLHQLHKLVGTLTPMQDAISAKGDYMSHLYVYTFPSLISVFFMACSHYTWTAGQRGGGHVSLSEIMVLLDILSIIFTLNDRCTYDWKHISASRTVVKDLRNKILAPLKVVRKEFIKARTSLQKVNEHIVALQAQARERVIKARRVLEREREQSQMGELNRRLRRLYMQRMHAEPSKQRWSWHAMPSVHRSLDADGSELERVDIFHSRATPHFEIGAEESEAWSDEEIRALIEGMNHFQGYGEHFWDAIFHQYCGNNGVLRKRRVFEMLRQAKYMREEWIADDEAANRVTDEWIRNVPDLDLVDHK